MRDLTFDDVITIHRHVLSQMEGAYSPLVRPNALQSAIAWQRAGTDDEAMDELEQALVLAVKIAKSKAFRDGNLRTGFAAFDVWLRLNGYYFAGRPVDLARRIEALACRQDPSEDEFNAIVEWIRAFIEDLPSPQPSFG